MRPVLVCLMLAGQSWAAPVIGHYSAEIRRESAGQYLVRVSVKVTGGEWAKPGFTLGPFQGGAFEGCVACESTPLGVLQRLVPAGGDGAMEASYRVAAAPAGEREYIPLAVPEIAGTAAPGSVEITVFPGEGMIPDGDMFPVLSAAGGGQWTVQMANMVSHVEFHATGAGGATFAQKWLGPRQWSDFAVLVMIVGGLLVRAMVTRKARSA